MQTQSLSGKVAVVTGAAGGIGAATALALAAEGARVVVADVAAGDGTVAEIASAGGEAVFLSCDVADPAQVEALMTGAVDRFGGIDVLVNNAGISGGSSLAHELEIDVWNRVLAVNLTGQFLCVRSAMPHLLASGAGRIVNVASTYGVVGAPMAPAYCASKGGVVNLTRQLAVDYSGRGIRVNASSPATSTPTWAAPGPRSVPKGRRGRTRAGRRRPRSSRSAGRRPPTRWRGWPCSWSATTARS